MSVLTYGAIAKRNYDLLFVEIITVFTVALKETLTDVGRYLSLPFPQIPKTTTKPAHL